ncbi:hypothetical protein FV222_14020 [Methylobacterium sp. WL103]|uniref:Uncharacterized protein n=1 Tax=Methylobacterium trifolii TaxID=1003092 RepID=A0ABQ4TWZ6_9HYPH|nr:MULTISPECIES: hypothetical protein [Methylobacterium]TXM98717.1 hypothetical protein FV222_14020 [Methylobacterium sp. WL103]GJE59785.1 hypothetical protein MPOCJGCO_1887 [Methylobacterium trifolii]
MRVHREFRDFKVLLEQGSVGQPDRSILGVNGDIVAGDVIVTLYRGQPERLLVVSIVREAGMVAWNAEVIPEPVVAGTGNVIAFRSHRPTGSDAPPQPLLSIPLGA